MYDKSVITVTLFLFYFSLRVLVIVGQLKRMWTACDYVTLTMAMCDIFMIIAMAFVVLYLETIILKCRQSADNPQKLKCVGINLGKLINAGVKFVIGYKNKS